MPRCAACPLLSQTKSNKKLLIFSARQSHYYVHFKAWRQWRYGIEIVREEKLAQRRQARRATKLEAAVGDDDRPSLIRGP